MKNGVVGRSIVQISGTALRVFCQFFFDADVACTADCASRFAPSLLRFAGICSQIRSWAIYLGPVIRSLEDITKPRRLAEVDPPFLRRQFSVHNRPTSSHFLCALLIPLHWTKSLSLPPMLSEQCKCPWPRRSSLHLPPHRLCPPPLHDCCSQHRLEMAGTLIRHFDNGVITAALLES